MLGLVTGRVGEGATGTSGGDVTEEEEEAWIGDSRLSSKEGAMGISGCKGESSGISKMGGVSSGKEEEERSDLRDRSRLGRLGGSDTSGLAILFRLPIKNISKKRWGFTHDLSLQKVRLAAFIR